MFSDRFQELHKAVDYLTHAESGFVVIEVNDRVSQNKCISFFETELTSKKIISVDLENTPEGMRPDNFIKFAVEDNPDIPIFCVLNMNGLGKGVREDEIMLLRNFNMGREKLADLDKLLVFFFPSYFVDLILRYARDFYDFAPLRITIPNPERQFMDRRDYEPEFADEKYLLNRVEFLKSRLDGNLKDEERFKVLMDLGDCYGKLYRWDEAIGVFERAVELAEEMGANGEQLAALTLLGKSQGKVYDFSAAEYSLLSGVELAKKNNDFFLLAYAQVELARVEIYIGNLDEAEQILKQAANIFIKLEAQREHDVAMSELASLLSKKGLYDEALAIHEAALDSYKVLGDSKSYSVTIREMSKIFVAKGDPHEAVRLCTNLLDEDKKTNDHKGYLDTLSVLVNAFSEMGQNEKALNLCEIRLREYEKMGDLRSKAITLFEMSFLEVSRNNFDIAMQYLNEAQRICRELGDWVGLSHINFRIGKILFSAGKYKKGVRLLTDALLFFNKAGFVQEAMLVKSNLDSMEAYAAANPLPDESLSQEYK